MASTLITTLSPALERTTGWVRGTLMGDGAAIPAATLATLTASIQDEDTGRVIMGATDILNADGGTVGTDGSLTLEIAPANMYMIDRRDEVENRLVVLVWTWPAGTPTKTGRAIVRIPVERVP